MAVIGGIWRDRQVVLEGGGDVPVDWFERMAHLECAFPDAAPAVRALHQRGVTLHLSGDRWFHRT